MQSVSAAFQLNDWHVDPSTDCISRGGTTLKLEARHMQVLLFLVQHAGEVLSSARIQDAVWGNVVVTQNSVYQAIGQLRRVLADRKEAPTYIETVARRGYRLIATVAPLAVPACSPAAPVGPPAPAMPGPAASSAAPAWQPAAAPALHAGTRWRGRWLPLLGGSLGVLGVLVLWTHLVPSNARTGGPRAAAPALPMLGVFSSEHYALDAAALQPTLARHLIDAALQGVRADVQQQPLLRAQMLKAIGQAYLNLQQLDDAHAVFAQALHTLRSIEARAEIPAVLAQMGGALRLLGRFEQARSTYLAALELSRAISGERSIEYARLIFLLGELAQHRGRAREALQLLNRSLELMRQAAGSRHWYVAEILETLGSTYMAARDFDRAEQAVRAAMDIYAASRPELDSKRIAAYYMMGELLTAQGRLEEAERAFRHAMESQRKLYGPQSLALARTLDALAGVYSLQDRQADAARLKQQASDMVKQMGTTAPAQDTRSAAWCYRQSSAALEAGAAGLRGTALQPIPQSQPR